MDEKKISEQMAVEFAKYGIKDKVLFDHFIKIALHLKLKDFDFDKVQRNYAIKYERIKSDYIRIFTDKSFSNCINPLGKEISEDFEYACIGFKKGEYHPETVLLPTAAIYLREFLMKYDAVLSENAKQGIQKLIAKADELSVISD